MSISKYHTSLTKRLFDLIFATAVLILSLPFITLISVFILISSGLPIFFLQRRVGKNGRIFKIVKFRTMVKGAEKMQYLYKHLNESDGPVFKIKEDPRFTRFGKILSKTGLDELPQFLNVLLGDMSIVGPRPLPVPEEKKLSKYHAKRSLVKPGITSSWVVGGSHKIPFKKWMELDLEYIRSGSLGEDAIIVLNTSLLIIRYINQSLLR